MCVKKFSTVALRVKNHKRSAAMAKKETHEKSWKKLDDAEKKLFVTLLRQDGFSDEAIADFFKATKGMVVGFRHRHLSSLTFQHKAVKGRSITRQIFDDLLDLYKMREMKENGVASIAAGSGYVAPQEVSQEAVERAVDQGKVVVLRPETVTEPVEEKPQPASESAPVEEMQLEEPPKIRRRPVSIPHRSVFKAEAVEEPGCQWPLSTGGSVKRPKLCNKPVVEGHKLCEEHLPFVTRRLKDHL